MVITININNNPISTSAKPVKWNLKNNSDHQKFKNNCNVKNIIATSFLFVDAFDFQTNHKLIPINKYNAVQTGPKIYEGGFHEGLIRLLNHGFINGPESRLLMIPVASQIAIEMINFHILNFRITFSVVLFIYLQFV